MFPMKTKSATALMLWGLTGSVGWSQPLAASQIDTDTPPTTLAPIVVTADLLDRDWSVQGQSVEILSEAELQTRPGLFSLRDALAQVANLSLVTGTGKAPTVRGVDGTGPAENANAFFAGSRPRLNWQIDGRPASYNEVVFGDLGLFDVERIEVLRGPQSSLVGRNAIAGTVVVKTRDPSFRTEGALRLAVGNHGQKQGSTMLNLPLSSERVAVRLTADWMQKESAVRYQSFDSVDEPGQIQAQSVQGKLLFVPDPERDSYWLMTVADRRYAGPNGEIIVQPFNEHRSNFPKQPRHEPRYRSLISDYLLDFGNAWQFQLLASATDVQFTRTAQSGTSSARVDTDDYRLEPQLQYQTDALTAVAGLYWYRARQAEFIEFLGGQNFNDDADTQAAYLDSRIPLASQWELMLGLRYEQEQRQREGGDPSQTLVRIHADDRYRQWLPKVGLTWSPTDNLSWGVQASKGYNAGGGGVTFDMPIVNYQYQQETAWTYELYGRQQWAQDRVRTTQNLFYSRYRGMQLPFDLTPDNASDEAFIVRNADRVDTQGLELGLEGRLSEHWQVWGSLGWLDTDVRRFPESGIEGNQLLTAPKFTGVAGVAWQASRLRSSLSARYSDAYFSDVNNRPRGKTDPYWVADAKLSYELAPMRWFAEVKNLFDEQKPVARYPGVAPAGSNQADAEFDSAVLLQPRTLLVGVELKY